MKKRIFRRAVLCAALACGLLAGSAGAYTMEPDGFTITPNQETLDFWTQYKYPLNDQGIYEHSADNWNFCPEFHDGLLLIQDTVSPSEEYATWDNYVDKSGNLHDLNRGRYYMAFSFSGGLAAVKSEGEMHNSGYNVGYIDTAGNEVIPCTDEWCTFQYSSIPFTAGRFENGRAVVLRSPELPDYGFYSGVDYPYPTDTFYYDTINPQRWYGIEYAYIDTQGNYLTDWVLTQDINTVINLPLYDQDGIRLSDRVYWGSGGGSSTGQPQPPEEVPYVPAYHVPELPDYNMDAPSLFASTAKVTGCSVGMADLGGVTVTVTNPGTVTDAGVVALVAMNQEGAPGKAGVFFIPYEVGPGASKSYSVAMQGIVHEMMFGGTWDASGYSDLLEQSVDACIVTFRDDDDLFSFYDTIPYEQYWFPQDIPSEFQMVCDGQPGTQWLSSVVGFYRPVRDLSTITYYPDGSNDSVLSADQVDHSICQAAPY